MQDNNDKTEADTINNEKIHSKMPLFLSQWGLQIFIVPRTPILGKC